MDTIFEARIGSYLGTPIYLSDHSLFGTICAIDPDPYTFSKEEVENMQRYANILAAIIEKKQNSRFNPIEEKILRLEKLSLVGQLAAGLGHELRNPLTSIKGLIQFLFEDEKHNLYRDIVLGEVDRMNTLITDFILTTQPAAPRTARCSLYDLVLQTTRLMEKEALLRGIEMTFEGEKELPLVEVDPDQMKQVMINVMKNAIEALEGQTQAGKVAVRVLHEGIWMTVHVKDNGPGISLSILNKITDPFFSTKKKGTGLGLSISKRIIEEHNGTILMENDSDGTSVIIRIPIPENVYTTCDTKRNG